MSPRPVAIDIEGHALSRYIERWYPDVHPRDVRIRLERYLDAALFVEDENDNQQSIWKLPDGALVVVDLHGIVRTVLPRGSTKPR